MNELSYAVVLLSFAVGSWSLDTVWPLVLNAFCDILVLASPADTGGGIKSPSSLGAGPAAP